MEPQDHPQQSAEPSLPTPPGRGVTPVVTAMQRGTIPATRTRTNLPRPLVIGLASILLVALLLLIAHPWSGGAQAPGNRIGAIGTAKGGSSPASGKNAPTATPSPQPTPTLTPLAGLSVQGRALVDASGKTVRLIGVTHASLEWNCAGDQHFAPSDFQAMKTWGANVVHLTLSSRQWANVAGDCPDYRLNVIKAIANARSAGLYTILTLQWTSPINRQPYAGLWQFPMPDDGKDVQFWRDLATLYRYDTTVLFDVFGEPVVNNWNLWAHGGTIGSTVGAYRSLGMWGMYTVIRAIAPNNVIIVSGDNWGWDLAGVTQGYAIPNATNLMYGSHPWSHWGSVNQVMGAIDAAVKQFPVIITEFGQYDYGTSWNGGAIAYFNAHQLSWIIWNWSTSEAEPFVLSKWDGTPNSPYGAFLRDQMLAAAKSAN